MSLDPATRARIEALLAENRVVLFMKGRRGAPMCGFSAATAGRLDALLDDYLDVNVLADPELREGIKVYGNWPTIPQLYVDGELIGGADIVQQMTDSGELQQLLGLPAPDRTPPEITLTDAAVAAIRPALADIGTQRLFLAVDARYQPQFELREPGANDIITHANGIEIHFDVPSAQRARGATINYTETPHGMGLAIFLPQAPKPIRGLSVQGLKARLDAGDITVIDVRPAEEREKAPFPGAEVFEPASHGRLTSLPKDSELAFLCHRGAASVSAAEHFFDHGFTRLWYVEGGIDAWSVEIDPSVPRY